jgi:hypothetical protein
MPIQLLRCVGVVVDIDSDGLTLLEAEQRPGELPVIRSGRENTVGNNFDWVRGDLDSAIGSAFSMRGRVYLSRGSRLGTTSGKREIPASAPVILRNLRLEQRMMLVLLTCQKQCCHPHRALVDYVAPCL